MIKVDKGLGIIKGSKPELYADLACLFEMMRREPDFDVDEFVGNALEISKKRWKNWEQKSQKKESEIVKLLNEFITELGGEKQRMKQPKKLSFSQKILVEKLGLEPFEWACHYEDKEYLHIINKKTKEFRIIDKKRGELIPNGN